MVSESEAILVEEVSFAGSGAADEDDVVSDPRLIEQPEAVSAINAIAGARRRDPSGQRWAIPIAIDTNYSRLPHLIGNAKYSRQKQKRGPEARVASRSM